MPENEEPSVGPVSVVTIDDHSIMRKSIRRILEREDFLVEDFPDVRSAIAYLQTHPVDLVLSDVYMVHESGFDLLRYVRGRSVANDIPVIFVTGEATRDDLIKAIELGATDYLLKPFEAAELLTKVKKVLDKFRNPDEFTKRIRNAEAFLLAGELEKGRSLFVSLLKKDPRNTRALTGLAQIESQIGEVDRALAFLNKAIEVNSLYFPAFVTASDILVAASRKDEAIRYLRKELEISGKRPYRRLLLAEVYFSSGDVASSLEQMRLALVDSPQDETLLVHMAEFQLKANDAEKSLHYYMKTRRQSPKSKRALDGIVNLCFMIQNPERAVRIFSDMLNLNPRQVDVLLARASVYERMGEHDKSLEDINRALELSPESLGALASKAQVLMQQKNHQDSLQIWQQVCHLAPEAQNFARVGLMYLKLAQYAEAASYYDKAVLLAPENFKFLFNLGFALEFSGRLIEATSCYEQVMFLAPKCIQAQDALRRIDIKKNPALFKAMQAQARSPMV